MHISRSSSIHVYISIKKILTTCIRQCNKNRIKTRQRNDPRSCILKYKTFAIQPQRRELRCSETSPRSDLPSPRGDASKSGDDDEVARARCEASRLSGKSRVTSSLGYLRCDPRGSPRLAPGSSSLCVCAGALNSFSPSSPSAGGCSSAIERNFESPAIWR